VPTFELSDEQAQLLATAEKLGGMSGLDRMYRANTVHNTLMGDAALRRTYEGLIKSKYPQAQTTDDVAAPYVAETRALAKRFDDYLEGETQRKNEELQTRRQGEFNGKWHQAVKDHDLTTEGEEALGKFMQDNGLFDPESAALLYFKRNPRPAVPVTPEGVMPNRWGIGPLPGEDEKSGKLLMDNPETWADIEAANILNELRSAA
jgi:hypothetical protein